MFGYDIEIKEKNGILLAKDDKDTVHGRDALLNTHKALNSLEVFWNIVIYMERLMKSDRMLDATISYVDSVGFLCTQTDLDHWVIRDHPKYGNVFLMNFFYLERQKRGLGLSGNGKVRCVGSQEHYAYTLQTTRNITSLACGCFTDLFCSRYDFAVYPKWLSQIHAVANKYAAEIDQYRIMFLVKDSKLRLDTLKSYGLNVFKTVNRDHVRELVLEKANLIRVKQRQKEYEEMAKIPLRDKDDASTRS